MKTENKKIETLLNEAKELLTIFDDYNVATDDVKARIKAILDEMTNDDDDDDSFYSSFNIIYRICDKTGEKFTEGFCFGDGERYFASEEHALEYAKEIGYESLDEAYNDDAYYFSIWGE